MMRPFVLALAFALAACSESPDAPMLRHGGTAGHSIAATRATARAIALRGLQQNTVAVEEAGVKRRMLLTGGHQFHDLWSRDFSFAAQGAMEAGLTDAVRDSLEAILTRQRADGLLPRAVDNIDLRWRTVLGTLGIVPKFEPPLKAWFETENGVLVIDGNALVPWAGSRYLARTRDAAFARRHYPAVRKALAFLEQGYLVDGAIGNQPPYSDWADSVARQGRVSFTTAVYVLALRGAASWASMAGEPAEAAAWDDKARAATERLQDVFWDDARGVLRNFDGDDRLTADANLLAVAHGMLPRARAERVMAALRASPIWTPLPRPTWPDYRDDQKSLIVKLVGLPDYHDSLRWIWTAALAARAECAVGRPAAARSILDRAAALIEKHGAVHELYELRSGALRPVKRLLYTAERPFTWSAAMYVEADAAACR